MSSNDYGKNYVRNLGVMNPANGVNSEGSFNGPGDAFAMLGTGTTLYAQAGYLLRRQLLKSWGTLQPYAAAQYADFELFASGMLMYEGGINWLIDGHRTKVTANYQSRPVFEVNAGGDYVAGGRKGMCVVQLQVSI